MRRERFAPSPTGLLHLGHAFSALTAFDAANSEHGAFLLRIEDIDQPRCKDEFEAAIYADLEWLGVSWETPVMRQSDRLHIYEAALSRLTDLGLTYRCVCTRKDILTALSAPQEGAALGPDGFVYPKTCQRRPVPIDGPAAIRLDLTKALAFLGDASALTYQEIGSGKSVDIPLNTSELESSVGDIVLARKDIGTSYHLAVVLDDAAQNITHVTRGEDMQDATPIHRILQALLRLPTPIYNHHRLIRDGNGKRLAKRYDAMSIRKYRAHGKSPDDIRRMVGLMPS